MTVRPIEKRAPLSKHRRLDDGDLLGWAGITGEMAKIKIQSF